MRILVRYFVEHISLVVPIFWVMWPSIFGPLLVDLVKAALS